LRRRGDSERRSRRPTRFALHCESLENRQLLSIGQTGLAAGLLVNPSVTSAQISISAPASSVVPAGAVSIEINIGTLAGLNQVEIFVAGGGPTFAPTSTASAGNGGSAVGTLSGSSGNSVTGLTLTSATTSSPSITPLNPNATSSTATSTNAATATTGGQPIYVVPPPLAPAVVHLGASTAPATSQSNSTLMSNLDELPPSSSRFGQGDVFEARPLFPAKVAAQAQSSSLIDFIEPFRPIAPAEVPQAQPAPKGEQAPAPAPAPDAATLRTLPPLSQPDVDAALGLTDARVLTRSRDGDAAQPDDGLSSVNTSWSLSAVFGAAAVAAGGYHLAMREADRFRGRWVPRWQGAERPNKRKSGSQSR
jgi:hypothetical protein